MKVMKNSEIYADGNKYLLEAGDEVFMGRDMMSEGIISRALLSIIRKIMPLDVFKNLPREFQHEFAKLAKNDPKKAKEASRKTAELMKLFGKS